MQGPELPRILYKYFPVERLAFLKERRIRASPPQALNDPFEANPTLETAVSRQLVAPYVDHVLSASWDDLIDQSYEHWPPEFKAVWTQEALKQLLKQNPPNRDEVAAEINASVDAVLSTINTALPRLRGSLTSAIDAGVGIICFSELPDQPLMWAHYADAHRGFVVGFDTSNRFFERRRSPDDEFYHLRQVRYSPDRPHVPSLTDLTGSLLFEVKDQQWAYEREWRMLVPLSDVPPIDVQGAAIHLVEVPSECIREVILGARMSSEHIDLVRQGFLNPELGHVRWLQAALPDDGYAVRLTTVTLRDADV